MLNINTLLQTTPSCQLFLSHSDRSRKLLLRILGLNFNNIEQYCILQFYLKGVYTIKYQIRNQIKI